MDVEVAACSTSHRPAQPLYYYDENIMITVINDIHVEPGGRTKEREKQCTGQSSSGKILSSRRDYLDQLDDRQWYIMVCATVASAATIVLRDAFLTLRWALELRIRKV